MATLLMRPADGGSADKKRRARKGKNAQKKQPQRGLGVAQLEKLRLQEQSLLCPASPASSVRLCATPSEHDMSQTMLSLTTSNVHAQGGGRGSSSSVVREAGAVSRLSTFSGHSSAQSCLSPSSVQDMNKGSTEAVDAAKRAVESRAFGCLSQSPNFSSASASFFSNVLTTTQLQILESQSQAQRKLEELRVTSAGDQVGNAPAYIFPSMNNHVKEAAGIHVNDAGFKLHPVFKEHVQSRIPLSYLTALSMLKDLRGPDVPDSPRKHVVVGVSPDFDRTNSTKELSSFQNYPSQQAWSTPDKVLGRKRPWLALQESTKHVCHRQVLDLNSPAGDSDAGHSERHSPVRLNQAPEYRVGAHYTTGIVRSALGNSCLTGCGKIKVCSTASPCHDSGSPSPISAYFSDLGMYSENGIGLRHCSSQSSVKDSCSSATGPSNYFTLNRRRCLNDPETPSSLVEKESICSNFLTLGISSASYPDRNTWSEPEESIQDSSLMSSNDVSRLKKQDSTTSCCEGGNQAFRTRKSVCKQEVGGDLEAGGPSTKCFSLDYGGGNYKRKTPMLLPDSHIAFSLHHSNRIPVCGLPPPSMTCSSPVSTAADQSDHRHSSVKSAQVMEGALDLRLKL